MIPMQLISHHLQLIITVLHLAYIEIIKIDFSSINLLIPQNLPNKKDHNMEKKYFFQPRKNNFEEISVTIEQRVLHSH